MLLEHDMVYLLVVMREPPICNAWGELLPLANRILDIRILKYHITTISTLTNLPYTEYGLTCYYTGYSDK
jgi:hypothetical protein